MPSFSLASLWIGIAVVTAQGSTLPPNPLPTSYSATALIKMKYGPDNEWAIGSKQIFSTSQEWETFTSSVSHGGDLGYELTNYNYSSPGQTFRYDYQSFSKLVGYLPDGVIDRDPFISPQKAYDLLANSSDEPSETLDDGMLVYTRKDPSANNRVTYIKIDPESNQVQWMENRFPDGTSTQRLTYSRWEPLGDGFIPNLIELEPDTIQGMRIEISHAKFINDTTPPPPKDLGSNYVIQDARKNKSYSPDGKELGPFQATNKIKKTSSRFAGKNLQTLITAAGVLLVVISGALIAKRRMGTH